MQRRRVFYRPTECDCKLEDYALFIAMGKKYPNYDRGPLPDWVSCKACNKLRYKNYPETSASH